MNTRPGRFARFLFLAAALLTAPIALLAQSQAAAAGGHYIVQLKQGVGTDPAVIAGRHGVAPLHVFRVASHGYSAVIPPGLLARIAADPDVAAIIPDRVMTAIGVDDMGTDAKGGKPGGGGGGGGGGSTQVVPLGVTRIGAAPGSFSYTGAGVGVAIVDTGIDYNHADLSVSASRFSAFGGSALDNNGHGTHVSGIVAAKDNSTDVVGVAPGATLYAVKVLDASGSGSDSDVMAGLDWVAANAAAVSPAIKVVNMSLGRTGSVDDNPALHQSVQSLYNLGITVVVAAGNDSSLEVSQNVPATYPEVFAIASTTAVRGTSATSLTPIAADTASYFTTDGAMGSNGIGVTISAPGEDEEDILKGNRLQSVGILSLKLGGGTTRMSGTSMATPHVTGVVALLYQKSVSLTPEAARTAVEAGASLVGTAPLDGRTVGYSFDGEREGVVSAPGALSVVP